MLQPCLLLKGDRMWMKFKDLAASTAQLPPPQCRCPIPPAAGVVPQLPPGEAGGCGGRPYRKLLLLLAACL